MESRSSRSSRVFANLRLFSIFLISLYRAAVVFSLVFATRSFSSVYLFSEFVCEIDVQLNF